MEKEGLAQMSRMADFEERRSNASLTPRQSRKVVHLFSYVLHEKETSIQDLSKVVSRASERYFEDYITNSQQVGDEVVAALYEAGELEIGDCLKDCIETLLEKDATMADILMFCLDFTREHAMQHIDIVGEIVDPALKNLIQEEANA